MTVESFSRSISMKYGTRLRLNSGLLNLQSDSLRIVHYSCNIIVQNKIYIYIYIYTMLLICSLNQTNVSAHDSYIGLDTQHFFSVKLSIFSYPSVLTFVLGAEKIRLIEKVLLSTHNICFG